MGQSDTMDFLSPRGKKKNQQAPLGNLLDEISPALTVWSHQMMNVIILHIITAHFYLQLFTVIFYLQLLSWCFNRKCHKQS